MAVIDPSKEKFPYCIVWTPLQPISWVFPFIGHTGIGNSDGIIYDFAGPYFIGTGKLAFGSPTRYIQLDPTRCTRSDWDLGIKDGNETYRHRMHNIFCDNCHSHVAQCLNNMGYDKKTTHGMIGIGTWFFFQGKFVSLASFIQTYLPFLIFVTIVVIVVKYVH